MSETYCTSADICQRLAIGRTTLWRWQRDLGFPAPLRLGRLSRFSQSQVDQWLAARRAPVGQDSPPSPA